MKPFLSAMIIAVVFSAVVIITKPTKIFYHHMECTGGIGGGCDRSTAKGLWKWLN
jgi:hypothetical protein